MSRQCQPVSGVLLVHIHRALGRCWAGAGAEEVTQHSAVDTKATATPHQTRVWPAIYHLFIANLYLDIPLFYLRYAHLIMPTFWRIPLLGLLYSFIIGFWPEPEVNLSIQFCFDCQQMLDLIKLMLAVLRFIMRINSNPERIQIWKRFCFIRVKMVQCVHISKDIWGVGMWCM